jgi:hypothetical protein
MNGFSAIESKLLNWLRRRVDDDVDPYGWLMTESVLQCVASACAAEGMKRWKEEILPTRDRIVARFRTLRIFDEDAAAVIYRPGTPPLVTLGKFHHVNADRLAAAMNPKAGDRLTQRGLLASMLYHHHVDLEETVPLTTAELMASAACNEATVSKALGVFFGRPGREKYIERAEDRDYIRRRLAAHLRDQYRPDEAAYGERLNDDVSAKAVSSSAKERKTNRNVRQNF